MLSHKILLVLTILLFLPITFSAPVTDLTISVVNAPTTINKDLNFQATWNNGDANVLYWQFDGDGNTTTTSDSYFPNNHKISTQVWTDVSGTWVETGELLYNADASGADKEIYSPITGASNDTNSISNFDVEWDMNYTVGGDIRFIPMSTGTTKNETVAGSGLWLTIYTGNNLELVSYKEGVGGAIYSDGAFDGSTNHRFKLERIDGNLSFYIDDDFTFSTLAYDVNEATNMIGYWAGGATQVGGIGNLDANYSDLIEIPIQSGASETHTFTTSGTKTVYLTVQNPDGNATSTLDFNIVGILKITVWDENKASVITGATVDFNSGTYTIDINGQVEIGLTDLTSKEYTINIDKNADYTSKPFVYDLNQYSMEDLNFLITETKDGTNRAFTVYQPNKTTLITNSIVEWRNTQNITNGISQRTKTSSTGSLNFFGQSQQTARYVMRINDVVGGVTRDYNGTALTITTPRDITDTNIAITPFTINVGGLAIQKYSNLTTDFTFQIYSDTDDYYSNIVSADDNSDYFQTEKLIKTSGGTATESWQTYLVPTRTDEGLQTTIYTIDNQNNRTSLPNIRIESYTTIGEVTTLVESKYSDGSGEALFHFDLDKEYTLYFYQDNVLKYTLNKTFSSSNSNLFVFIETGTFEIPTAVGSITVEWYHSPSDIIPDVNGIITIWQYLRPRAMTIGDVNIVVTQNSTIILTTGFTVNSDGDYNAVYDVNTSGLINTIPLKVSLDVYNTSGELIYSRTAMYSFIGTTRYHDTLENLKSGLGLFATTCFILLFLIYGMWLITSHRVGEDNNFLFAPMAFITGVGVFFGLIDITAWFIAILFGLSLTAWKVRD